MLMAELEAAEYRTSTMTFCFRSGIALINAGTFFRWNKEKLRIIPRFLEDIQGKETEPRNCSIDGTYIGAVAFECMGGKIGEGNHFPVIIKIAVYNGISFVIS